MRSQDKKTNRSVLRLAILSVFLALTLAISFVERLIPLNIAVPGVRLGLSNIVILLLLYIFLPAEVFGVVILKCMLTAVLWGTGASFIYSLSGSLLSFLVMTVFIKLGGKRFSPIGVSVSGAVFHNTGQILAACLMLSTVRLFAYLPVLLISGIITGIITGIAVKYTLKHIRVIYHII